MNKAWRGGARVCQTQSCTHLRCALVQRYKVAQAVMNLAKGEVWLVSPKSKGRRNAGANFLPALPRRDSGKFDALDDQGAAGWRWRRNVCSMVVWLHMSFRLISCGSQANTESTREESRHVAQEKRARPRAMGVAHERDRGNERENEPYEG